MVTSSVRDYTDIKWVKIHLSECSSVLPCSSKIMRNDYVLTVCCSSALVQTKIIKCSKKIDIDSPKADKIFIKDIIHFGFSVTHI